MPFMLPARAPGGTSWDGRRTAKLIWVSGTAVLLTMWLVVYLAITDERAAALAHARHEAGALSAAFANEARGTLNTITGTMTLIARRLQADPAFSVYQWADGMPPVAIPAISAIAILGPDGRLKSSSLSAHPEPLDLSGRDYFRRLMTGATQGPIITKPMIGMISHQLRFLVARRVNAANGHLLGIIVVGFSPSLISTLGETLGREDRLSLFGSDRVIRARFSGAPNAPLANVGATLPPLPVAVPRGASAVTYIGRSALDGVTRLYSVRRVRGYDLMVSAGLDLADVLAPADATARKLGIVGILFTLFLFAILTALCREIRRRAGSQMELAEQKEKLAADVERRQIVEARLRESEAMLDRAQEIAGLGSWELDLATGALIWSKQMYRIRGFSPDTFQPSLQTIAPLIHPDEKSRQLDWLQHFAQGNRLEATEIRVLDARGHTHDVLVEGVPIVDPDGVIRRVAGTMEDVTERRLLERQLREAQKIEAIGTLSGGMAHDFNNILGIIIGNLQLLAESIADRPDQAELCGDALDAARRGADLTRRLLAYARRQPLRAQSTDVNRLLTESVRLLRRLLGDAIQVSLRLASTLPPVLVDPAQLEATITNLVTNARDAMPHGGQLIIATRVQELDRLYAATHPDVVCGEYVVIEVTDTGSGMTQEVLGRIFEPFFTTKEQGKGTGLGLSMAFGFMKQSGGHMTVYSELGHGTTIRLYLPYNKGLAPAAMALPRRARPGYETVLVVEDNADLRRVTVKQLRDLGYEVLEAESGGSALGVIDRAPRLDLVLTDIVMPGAIDGVELARLATQRRQGVKILLMSGFSELRFSDQLPGDLLHHLLNKPFSRDELGAALRDVLDAEPATRETGGPDNVNVDQTQR